MRKFPGGIGGKRKMPWANIVYFAIGWNVFGLVLYKLYDRRRKEDDDKWSNQSSTQKYMSLMSPAKTNVTSLSVEGLSVDTKETTMEEVLKPKKT